jgi:hypothetical protein
MLGAARELSASREAGDEALGPLLLRDIRALYDSRGVDRFASADLAAGLNELEESPWGDIRGNELDARSLARLLRRYTIRPRTIRLDNGSTPKGYHREQFRDAFSRYLGVSERHTDTTGTDTEVAAISEAPHVADAESRKPASVNERGDVAVETAENGDVAGYWLARDGVWRSFESDPPNWPGEAVARRHVTQAEPA